VNGLSFRARIALLTALAIAVTVTAASVAVWMIAKHELYSQLDQTLADVDSGRLPVSVAARRLLGAFAAGIAANARRH